MCLLRAELNTSTKFIPRRPLVVPIPGKSNTNTSRVAPVHHSYHGSRSRNGTDRQTSQNSSTRRMTTHTAEVPARVHSRALYKPQAHCKHSLMSSYTIYYPTYTNS